jgi:hypothetical protein
MTRPIKSATFAGAAALLLGASLALSSARTASSASTPIAPNRIHPDKKTSITCNKTTNCFTVTNTGSGNAVAGQANYGAGLYGFSTSSTGLYGQSTYDFGVYGTSQHSYGVDGYSQSSTGVYGASSAGDGVYGTSSSGHGVYGYTTGYTGTAGFMEASPYNTYFALIAQADNTYGSPFRAYNKANDAYFYVDPYGDGYFTGSVTAVEGYQTGIRTRSGDHVRSFGTESTQATIEDTGTARLEAGEGVVRFDSTFASTIDASRGYQVFLTPNGETRGWLYVAAKYEGGFIVREGLRGRSSTYFDYRVVAHPYGSSNSRLPRVNVNLPALPPNRPRSATHIQP